MKEWKNVDEKDKKKICKRKLEKKEKTFKTENGRMWKRKIKKINKQK